MSNEIRVNGNELPDGWEWINFDEATQIIPITDKKVPQKEYLLSGRLPIIDQGQKLIGGYTDADDKRVHCDLPVIVFGDHTRALKFIDFDFVAGADGIKVIKPNEKFLPHLFFYFLHCVELPDRGYGRHFQFLRDHSIPLPPLPEQKRIVEKIEKLFAESRTAREALDGVPTLLKRFRQSVLAKAFRGELVEHDPIDESASVLLERIKAEREKKKIAGKKYVEPAPIDTSELSQLPDTWCWTSVGEIIDVLQYGTSVKAGADAKKGIPVLRMGNIQDGRVDFNGLKFIDPAKDDIPKYILKDGDVLINRTNSPELVGKAALFEGKGKFIFASYLIRLKVNPELALPHYLVFLINSEIGRQHVVEVKHQVAGQANINSQNIREMPFPLAPLAEQRRIVAKIESLFAQADEIEQAVEVARRRAQQIDQAILARAFRGGM